MFWDQHLLQARISRHEDLYLGSDLYLGCISWLIAMEPIAYTTVINANRPGLWPCHEGYAEKQVTSKARHNSDGEVPYEKTKVAQNYPDNYEIIY